MRSRNWKCFDEFLPKGVTGDGAVYTPTQFNDDLAKASHLGIHVIADNITAVTSGNLMVYLEEGSDGRNFIQRGSGAIISIDVATDSTLLQAIWSDGCQGLTQGSDNAGPLMGFVRFKIAFDDDDISAHVKIYVTQRNH